MTQSVIHLAGSHESEPGALHIGARWRPGHVIRRDTERGTYEELNPVLETMTEALVQRALLAKKPPSLLQRLMQWRAAT